MVSVHRVLVPLNGELDHTNAYLLAGRGDAWLIDTGYDHPGNFELLVDGLADLGYAPGELTGVFITHRHPDHTGLLHDLLCEAPQLRLLIPEPGVSAEPDRGRLKRWLRAAGPPPGERRSLLEYRENQPPTNDPYDRLERGRTAVPGPLPGGLPARILRTPGHTLHHRSLLVGERFLFSGDHLLPHETPHIGYMPGHATESPLTEYLNSLRHLGPLDPDRVYPGHGDPFPGAARRIEQLREHHRTRLEETRTAVETGAQTVWEAAHGITWSNGKSDLRSFTTLNQFLALAETYAHVLHLRRESRLQIREDQMPLRLTTR